MLRCTWFVRSAVGVLLRHPDLMQRVERSYVKTLLFNTKAHAVVWFLRLDLAILQYTLQSTHNCEPLY